MNLKDVGLLELTFALTPMLGGFCIGTIPLSALMWLILILIVLFRYGKFRIRDFKPLTIFIIYWFLHQFLLLFIIDVNFNSILAQLLYFASVYVLYTTLDPRKLRGAMNWVAIISIAGLLYQWMSIVRGIGVHPLEIPGLSMEVDRLETESLRPSSFYMEPAAYVSFMVCPLLFSLLDKKYLWSAVLILSFFLTTSTTGIFLSFVLLVTSLFTRKFKFSSFVVVVVLGCGLFYSLKYIEAFNTGIEKLENTDSSNVRLSQGPKVVGSMHPEEFVFGVPYSSAYNYCKAGRYSDVEYYGESVYMSTFWNMILLYGIVGLFLYLMIYLKLFRMSRLIWPLLFGLCATMFSDPDIIQNNFIYKLIFMLVIATNDPSNRIMISPNNKRQIA